jgi:hypothetical protein
MMKVEGMRVQRRNVEMGVVGDAKLHKNPIVGKMHERKVWVTKVFEDLVDGEVMRRKG